MKIELFTPTFVGQMRPCLIEFLTNPPKFTVLTDARIHRLPNTPRVQTDGSFGSNTISRTAFLYRDRKGKDTRQVKTYFHHKIPTESEWCSVLDAMKYASKRDEGFLELENDNLGIVRMLIREIEPVNPIHYPYYSSIQTQLKNFDYVAIRWIPREMNSAHNIFRLK